MTFWTPSSQPQQKKEFTFKNIFFFKWNVEMVNITNLFTNNSSKIIYLLCYFYLKFVDTFGSIYMYFKQTPV